MTLTLAYEMATQPKRGRNRRAFTPEEDATIRAMITAGASYSEVSRVLDRSEAVIGKKVRALEVKRPDAPRRPRQSTFTPEEDAVLIAMCAGGASYSQMASVFSCSRYRVQLRVGDLGIVKAAVKPGPAASHVVTVDPAAAEVLALARATHCRRCGVLLTRAPAGVDGMCGWCEREATP